LAQAIWQANLTSLLVQWTQVFSVMVLPQCSLGLVFLLSASGFDPAHGLGNHQVLASLGRRNRLVKSTLSLQKILSNASFDASKETTGLDKQQKPDALMNRIIKLQIEQCVHMKYSWSSEFKAYEQCLELLLNLCHPGADRVMDGDDWETPTGIGYCRVYFTYGCVTLCERKPRTLGYEERLAQCDPHMKKLCAEDDGDEHMDRETIKGYCLRYFRVRGTTTTAKQSTVKATTTTTTTTVTTSPDLTPAIIRSESIERAGSTRGANGDSNEVGKEWPWWLLAFDVALGLCLTCLCCVILLLLLKKPASDDEDSVKEDVAN